MFLPLFMAFTLLPAIEIYFLFKIGSALGGLNTFLFVIFTGAVGAYLAKLEGRLILQKISNELNRGQIPSDSIISGLLIFAGGLLLLTPGFLTDFIGFSFVFPGTRHLLVVFFKGVFGRAIQSGNVQFYSNFTGTGMNGSSSYHYESYSGPKQVGPDTFEAEYKKKS